MKELKRILSYTRRAVDDYSMIEDGDKIAVGVSAGKDSLALLYALAEMRRFYPKKFELIAITVDMGFPDMSLEPVREFCERIDVEFHIAKTQIYQIIFEERREKSPCSLCAKMRRGVLYNTAKELGCNKVALGHHFDDAIETFMLNLFFEGRIGCFSPVTYLSRKDITMIRPLLYASEKSVRQLADAASLPVVKSKCPADGNTEREEMKKLLRELDIRHKGLRYRIFGAMQRGEIDGFKPTGGMDGIKDYENDIGDGENE